MSSPARRFRWLHRDPFAILAVAPGLLTLTAVVFVPAAIAVLLSLTSWNGLGPIKKWVGTTNYSALMNDEFLPSLGRSLIFVAVVTPMTVGLGFVLASVIHLRLRGWRFYKVAWFIPVILPGTVVGIVWSTGVFAANGGLASLVTSALHGSSPAHGWLGDPFWAYLAIVVAATWSSTGWPMIVLLAGMERISPEINEAASLEGCSFIRRTIQITLPLTWPVVAAVITLQTIFALRAFDIIYVMTNGGPATATTVLMILVYNLGFTQSRFGLAAAVAVVAAVVIVFLGMTQRLVFQRLDPT